MTVALALAAITASVLGAFAWLTFRADLRQELGLLRREHQALTDQLAVSLVLPIWNFDRAQIARIVESALADEKVIAVVVRPADVSNSLIGSERGLQGEIRPIKDAREIPDGLEQLTRPIEADQGRLGQVSVFVTTRFVRESVRADLVANLWRITVLDAVLVASVYGFLWWLLLRPLRVLENDAQAMQQDREMVPAIAGRRFRGEMESLRTSLLRLLETLQLHASSQDLLTKIATTYINLPLEAVEPAIHSSLGEMGALVSADRVQIFDYDFVRQVSRSTHEWCRAGVDSRWADLQALPLGVFPAWILDRHRRGESVFVAEVRSLPPGALREVLNAGGTRSALAVPLLSFGECLGFVSFAWTRSSHAYSASEQRLLAVFAHMLVNIRQRQRAEIVLRESEEKFATAFRESPGNIAIRDLEQDRFLDVNDHLLAMMGYTREEVVGHSLRELGWMTEADHEEIGRLLTTGTGVRNREMRFRRRDGNPVYCVYNAAVIQIGGRRCLLSTSLDITERKRAENEMRTLLRTAPVGIASIRHERIAEANEALGDMLGYTREELLHQSVRRFFPSPGEEEQLMPDLLRRLGNGEAIEAELRAKRKDGAVIDLLLRLAPIDPARPAAGSVGMALEITARKQAATLQQAKAQADAANRAKSTFLANMSHEIRTPLNAILGFAQLLGRDRSLTASQREHLHIIGRSGEHLLVLINDILEMSKIEAQQVTLVPVSFDPRILARDLHAMFSGAAAAKGLHYTVEAPPDLPALVVADQGKLRQILVNLLGNAFKFTNRGRVVLRLRAIAPTEHGRRLLAEVEDTGPGIDPGEIGRLFAPFEQTALGRKCNTGTGLGLAISRQFARLMGGDVSLESELGRGSVFRVEIQIGQAAAGADDDLFAHPRALGMPDARARRVLVVDDSADNRRLLCEMLAPVGCEIREASGGAEAFSLFAEWQPHLILMDLRMPVVDGCDAIRQVRAHRDGRQVKIVCHSASVFSEDRDQAFAAGADDFISKPFGEAVLWDKLRTMLDLPDGPLEDSRSAAAVTTAWPVGPHQPLPPELENVLRQAVLELDMDHIMTLIAQVAELDPAWAERLAALATQFDYDGLAALLSPQGESPAE